MHEFTASLPIAPIAQLFAERGHTAYAGEAVTQLEHALQTADLALGAGAPTCLVVAALLHDVGHLVTGLDGTPTLAGIDDRHERTAARWLRRWFGPGVTGPIALHVEAKRYLASVGAHRDEAERYLASLSDDSRRSLALQGGPMSGDEARAFRRRRWAEHALQLRAWDDAAKVQGRPTPALEHFVTLAASAVRRA